MSNIITLHPSVTAADVFDMMHVYKEITNVTAQNGRACFVTRSDQGNFGFVKIPVRKGQLRGLPSNPVKEQSS